MDILDVNTTNGKYLNSECKNGTFIVFLDFIVISLFFV